MKPFVLLSALFLVSMFSCYKPIQKPDDFDKFWQLSLKELKKSDSSSIVKDTIIGSKKISLVAIQSYNDTTIYSWLSEPIQKGKYPMFIEFFGFDKGNIYDGRLPKKKILLQENKINMFVYIRGQGMQNKVENFTGHLTMGLEKEDNYIYKGAFLDAVKAVDYANGLSINDGNIVVKGKGQGATLAIAATALNPKVTMCIVSYPFFTNIYNLDKTKWPMKIWIHETKIKERKLEDLHETLSYFEMLNFAQKINVPFFLKTQETDTITPKEGAIKLFKAIKHTNKELFIATCVGHGCSSKSEQGKKLEYEFIRANMKFN